MLEDLPDGLHVASLQEVLWRFGKDTLRRKLIAARLERVYKLAIGTGRLKRFVIFGSFVSSTPDPNDVDVFIVMNDDFDVRLVTGEARLVFDHSAAQSHFGASIFWVRGQSAAPDEEQMILGWGLRRDGTKRGIVEVTED